MGLQSAKGASTVVLVIGCFLVCCDAVLLLTCAPLNELTHTRHRYQREAKAKCHKMEKGLSKRPPTNNPHVEENVLRSHINSK